MNDYGITENSRRSKILQYKKYLRLNTSSFLAAILLPFLVVLLFAFGVIKGKKTIGAEYAVALIDADGSFGSGFRISETKMLTAKHVVDHLKIGDEVSLIFKKFETPIEATAKILFMPSENLTGFNTSNNDFAILEITDTRNLNEVPTLILGFSEDIETREEVYAVGYPTNNPENKVTDGIISSTLFSSNAIEYNFLFDVDVDVDNGNSGGPLILNSTDEVIGVMIMVNEGNHSKANLALKTDEIRLKLEEMSPTLSLDE